MGIDGGKERHHDGYPFEPQPAERPLFARCVRNALVEHVLDGATSVVRFGDGQRFKFPVPEGDKLLAHVVHADVIAVQGTRKSIQVTVRFPCIVPHATWASDPFEATMRIEYVPEHWQLPKTYGEGRAEAPVRPQDAGIDLSLFRDEEVPGRPPRSAAADDDRWHGFRSDVLEQEANATPAENGGGIGKFIHERRLAIAGVLALVFATGWIASEHSEGISKAIRSARQHVRTFFDWIDGAPRPLTPPPPR